MVPGTEKKRTSIYPESVEEVRQAVRARGGELACPVCGRDEFALEEVAILGAGRLQQYGSRRLRRAQLICENCGGTVSMDPSRLGADEPAGDREGVQLR